MRTLKQNELVEFGKWTENFLINAIENHKIKSAEQLKKMKLKGLKVIWKYLRSTGYELPENSRAFYEIDMIKEYLKDKKLDNECIYQMWGVLRIIVDKLGKKYFNVNFNWQDVQQAKEEHYNEQKHINKISKEANKRISK